MSSGKQVQFKQVIIMIAILVCCGVAFVALSGLEDGRLVKVEDISLTDNSGVIFNIDQPTMGDIIFFDNCYAGIKGEPIGLWDLSLVLVPQGESYGYAIPTYMQYSDEAGAIFEPGNEYFKRVGFKANVKADKLSLSSTEYDVLLYYNHDDKDIYVDTGLTLTQEGIK